MHQQEYGGDGGITMIGYTKLKKNVMNCYVLFMHHLTYKEDRGMTGLMFNML